MAEDSTVGHGEPLAEFMNQAVAMPWCRKCGRQILGMREAAIEIARLRAELAVLRGRIADDAALVSEYTLLLRDAYNLCNPAWPWMHGLRERIRAALAAKEE